MDLQGRHLSWILKGKQERYFLRGQETRVMQLPNNIYIFKYLRIFAPSLLRTIVVIIARF